MIDVMAPTKAKPRQKSSEDKAEAKELSRLLEKAMQQAGVKEVMEVYGEWSKTNEITMAFQTYQNPYSPNTVSSSSELV
jgi:hypothetical protein